MTNFLPDLILTNPVHIDYPLFRKFIKDSRKRFNKAIIVFTDMNVPDLDYRQHIRKTMAEDKVTFLKCLPAEANEDWRNKAIKMALTVSTSDWICFMEQDFIVKEGFFEDMEALSQRVDVFGYYQDERLHPCCIYIKRALLDKTCKNFSPIPDISDHFSRIQRDLEKKDILIGVIPHRIADHMNGLSQNIHILQEGGEPNYNPEAFRKYCEECLTVEDIHPDFKKLFEWYLEK